MWVIASMFFFWLLPDILVYSITLFMSIYFGGEPGDFPVGKSAAAATIFGVAISTSVYLMI